MRLVLLTLLVLIAFASNSVLTRAGLVAGGIGPGAFTAIRLISGAAVLALLMARRGVLPWAGGSFSGALTLYVYAVALSFSYIAIPTGLGALILFGAVQVTMIIGGLVRGQAMSPLRWIGSALALAGLAVLGAPGADAPVPWAALVMGISGVAWGLYSLIGARGGDPTVATAGNFVLAAPLGLLTWIVAPGDWPAWQGVVLALVSGGITSALGYALWYAILPRLDAAVAGLAQLTVPLIALGGGMLFLAEPATWRFALAALLILGGVGLGLIRR